MPQNYRHSNCTLIIFNRCPGPGQASEPALPDQTIAYPAAKDRFRGNKSRESSKPVRLLVGLCGVPREMADVREDRQPRKTSLQWLRCAGPGATTVMSRTAGLLSPGLAACNATRSRRGQPATTSLDPSLVAGFAAHKAAQKPGKFSASSLWLFAETFASGLRISSSILSWLQDPCAHERVVLKRQRTDEHPGFWN